MPFISEEIWQRVAPLTGTCGDTIMLQRWPEPAQFPVDAAAEAELQWIRSFVLGVRQIRGEMDIPPGKRLTVLLQDATAADQRLLDVHARYLRDLARLDEIRLLPAGEQPPASATALLGNLKILVPMAGLIDVAAERARLEKNRQKLGADLVRIDSKLAQESFVSNAPAAVVEKERERQAALRRDLAKLEEQLQQLAAL
jgi:valyl-tRNA synthetase